MPPASEAAIAEREKELGFPLPGELRLLYRLCDGFALFRREGTIDIDGSPFRLVPIHQLQPFAWTTGDELPKRTRKAKARSLEEAIEDPARLQVFDLGNGDFVSCVAHGTSTLWIDDYSDGPQRMLTNSLAEFLEYVLSEERIDLETGGWRHRAWQGLHLDVPSE